jgi:hypothetical protein
MTTSRTLSLGLTAVALVSLAAIHPASADSTTNFTLPLTTTSSNKLDLGPLAAGSTFKLTFTGTGDLVNSNFQTSPDGSLAAPAAGPYAFANSGAAYSTAYGGDGINHFVGGGANYDSTGSGFPFAGKLTTDTTDLAAIRAGAVVGTFSATPSRTDWFYIGSGDTFSAPTGGGELFVAVADSFSSDNHGSYAGALTAPAAVPEAATAVSLGFLLVLGGAGLCSSKRRGAGRE